MLNDGMTRLAAWVTVLLFLSGPFHPVLAASDKHALLIGIQDYPGGDVKALRGPRNDIAAVEKLLRTRFGVPEGNIITLLDPRATHTGIRGAFAELDRRVNPGDFVYIQYTGHGAQTRDLNDDERSGKDQTWVSYGARTGRFKGDDDYEAEARYYALREEAALAA